jgi:hypothetical protein
LAADAAPIRPNAGVSGRHPPYVPANCEKTPANGRETLMRRKAS